MTGADESHRKLMERHARVLEGADESFWDWDLKSNEFRVSFRFETMLGYAPGELPGREEEAILILPGEWAAYVHPDDLGKAWESIERHLQGLTPIHEIAVRCKAKSGEWRWLLVKGRVVQRDGDGAPLIMSGTHADITVRKNAEKRAHRLACLYRTLSESNEAILKFASPAELFSHICRILVDYSGMVYAWVGVPDSEGRFISAGRYGKFADPTDPSRLADPFFQFTVLATPERPEGRGPSGIAFRENRPVMVNDVLGDDRLAPWHESAKNRGIQSMAALPIVKSGRPYGVFSVYSDQADFFDDEIVALLERLAGNLGFALDRLEHKTLLFQSEERFRTLFENAGDGIFIGDTAGRLVDVNAHGAQMLGYPREEIRTLSVRDILAEHDRDRVPDNWEGWEVGSHAVSAWTFLRKDGSTFVGEVNSQVLPDGRFMGILRDVTERNRMMAFLEEKEALLSLFVENAPAAVAMFDSQMRYLAVSKRFIENYRLSGKELIGHCHYELFPNIPERWREAHRRGLAGETLRMAEDRYVRANGSTEWIRWEIKPWYSGSEVGGIVLFTEMITDLKRVEEERTRLSAQLQLALIAARLGWWQYDPATKTASYDERYREIFQVTGSEQPNEEILKRLHPDDLPGVWAKVEAALDPTDPKPYETEYRIILPDGLVRWIQAHGMAIFEGEGQARHAVSLIGTVSDVTEQHQIQEALRESEARYRALFEHSPDAILLGESSGRIFEANAAACSMLGMSQDEIVRRGRQGIVEDTPALRAALEERARTGIMPATEMTYIRQDGSPVAVEVCSVVFGDGPDEMRSLIIARDITERNKNKAILKESEERYRTLVESAGDAYFVHDPSGRLVEVNRMACDSLGYTRQELLGMNVFEDIEQDVDAEQAKELTASLNPGQVLTLHGHHRRKDGHVFPIEVRASFFVTGGQKLFISLVRDISERQKTEEELKLAAAVYRDSSEAMMVLDEHRHIIMVNQAFTAITGYTAADVIGRQPSFLRASPEDDAFYADLWEQVHKTGRFKGEVWHKKKDGQFIAVQNTTNAISGGSHLPNRYVVLLSDITEKKRSDDMLWSQANFDTLTGLPNRRFFRDRLEHEVRNARRSKLPLALLFIDLDGFKDVNDTLGHDMGDVLLKEAADRLYRCVRESDTVARLGGDEFTVILSELHDPGNVDRVARHILQVLSDPIKLGDELAHVSGSIGITLFPNDATEVEDLIRNADQAMYAAKHSGKNQFHYFTPAMQEEALKRMRIINDLRGALDDNQFEIMYQPIVDLSSGAIMKAEALIRWQHPRKGLISPIEFISAAEDTGMISAFGNWIFHEAAKQAASWRERYHPEFQISVNISPVQFRKAEIVPSVWFDHLKELDLPGQGIVVEITEGLLLDASQGVKDQLLMLRDAGIEVALDDFGTGYSSLAYLKKFDIDYVKIDQAFVRNLSQGSDDIALCGAIIVMAHQLGLKVIAEGVETSRQHELLANAGCDFAQGYLFSRPLPASDFERLLNADPFSLQEVLDL